MKKEGTEIASRPTTTFRPSPDLHERLVKERQESGVPTNLFLERLLREKFGLPRDAGHGQSKRVAS